MKERSQRSGFSRSLLDRAADRRGDAGWLAAVRDKAHFILFDGERPLFRTRANPAADPIFDAAEAHALQADMTRAVFLGIDGDTPIFAAPVPEGDEASRGEERHRRDREDQPRAEERHRRDREDQSRAEEGHARDREDQSRAEERHARDRDELKPIDVRSIAVQGLVGPELLGPIAQAKSMLDWHARHGFCANCGAPTAMSDAGYRRDCAACGAHHFPRTDPVVIMLAIDGEDCLLARAPRFQPGMFSALAGFVEPGETIEEAVRREVKEEAGIVVERVAYHSSQPWPFPSSLMIGCFARAATHDITIDRQEIEEGRWFSRTEISEMLNHRHPDGLFTPPPMAIAHQLLNSFVAGEAVF